MVIDITIPSHRVRLRVSDFTDIPILTDDVIDYYLVKNKNNEDAATKECALIILGVLARTSAYDKINVLISDTTKTYGNYKDYLLSIIKNPALSNIAISVYAGGVSKSDMAANDANPDNNVRPSFNPAPQNWL